MWVKYNKQIWLIGEFDCCVWNSTIVRTGGGRMKREGEDNICKIDLQKREDKNVE